MALTKKRTLKYTLLPEVLPRIGSLFGTGFFHVAYLIAILFETVRLIPRAHPYLNPQNMGRFGIRHVIAEAAGNLQFKRANLDQIFIFATILAGLILLVIQIVLIGVAFFAQPVIAASFAEWFTLDAAAPLNGGNDDIALMLLDRVFGVQEIFNSCVSTAEPCTNHMGNNIDHTMAISYPYPIHLALHQLFYMYSIAIGIISMMIIVYFIITIIGETAVTGTPFGQRFNKTWAPVRLIMFFALLAPLNFGDRNEGLNGAQLITLWTAKFGSNFATNAWVIFNDETARAYYQPEELIAIPGAPDHSRLAQFFTLVSACVYGEKLTSDLDIQWYLVREDGPAVAVPNTTPEPGSNNTLNFTRQNINDSEAMLEWTNNAPPQVVIGLYDRIEYANYTGYVKPICGSFSVPTDTISEPGALRAFEAYFALANLYMPGHFLAGEVEGMAHCIMNRAVTLRNIDCDPADPYGDYQELIRTHMASIEGAANNQVQFAVDEQINNGDFDVTDELVAKGWGGAAIWFNRIAAMNGALAAAMYNIPTVTSYPLVMEMIKEQQMQNTNMLTVDSMFRPTLDDGNPVRLPRAQDDELASAYYQIFTIWSSNIQTADPETAIVGNPIIDTINAVFGTSGLFNMREPATGASDGNPSVHPLALMTSLGRSMVQAAVNNLAVAAGSTVGGGLLSIMQQFTGTATLLKTAGSFLFTVATTTIMIGLMLGYVLPLMPFIYFFFAIGGWIKSIFEAMVAMPIWALAHIRIDGEGMPGPGATNGYFLLFEIFLRPILILAGLLASILIFSAMVQVLNQIFDIMVVNVAGVDREAAADPTSILYYRGPIDELFYSVMYAAIVYMMGLSCFKLIDAVPNNILRWMGVSVATFKEQAGDPAGQLSDSMYRRGNMMVNQISGGFENNAGRLAIMAGGR